jgi:hypothetical protein
MRDTGHVAMEQRRAISRLAHVVERVGLAMAGSLCGLYVGADAIRAQAAFDSIGFILAMCLIGTAGFYLGIDVPRHRALDLRHRGIAVGVNPVEWLSATGTLLTAMAALVRRSRARQFLSDAGGWSAPPCKSARAPWRVWARSNSRRSEAPRG